MIAENLERIRTSIERCALSCRRNPADIHLIAVSKKIPVAAIRQAIACGQQAFGENYIQEAEQKWLELDGAINLHFIGHLQSNKAKIAARIASVIETVDSLKLAEALNRHLETFDRTIRILIQVNVGNDPNKSGVLPGKTEELLRQVGKLPRLQVAGLMTIPPLTETPEATRPHFRALRLLADEMADKQLFHDSQHVELSMGMSDDFEIAIEEGATMVRIGTAIFGSRPAGV
ncbi:MAG: YggS family pyridoxal phosphate-dependent enzyme [Desulfobulbaceae bacterium]|nr:MAG: YggS family pyridoxal phosphate-dependent enzyme [Desulfobulbaceae bacterium]